MIFIALTLLVIIGFVMWVWFLFLGRALFAAKEKQMREQEENDGQRWET